MNEVIIAAGIGAALASIIYYFGNMSEYRWWTTWIPRLGRRRHILTVISALIGAAVAAAAEILVSVMNDDSMVTIGAGIGVTVITSILLGLAPATAGTVPLFELLGTFIQWHDSDSKEAVEQEVTRCVLRLAATIGSLENLVKLCEHLHDAGVSKNNYDGANERQKSWTLNIRKLRQAVNSVEDEERNEAFGQAQGLTIQMVLFHKTTAPTVALYLDNAAF